MARRGRKSDTEKATEIVIMIILWTIFFIPLSIYYVIKWLCSISEQNAAKHQTTHYYDDYDYRGKSYSTTYGNSSPNYLPVDKAPSAATKSPKTIYKLKDIDNMDGLRFETYVAELLRTVGFSNVSVTPPSGDFGVDILAHKNNIIWAFQCKNYSAKLGVKPIQEVYSGLAKYNATKAVVITNSYFSAHAQELAEILNVELWDRDVLEKLLNEMESSINNTLPINKSSMSTNWPPSPPQVWRCICGRFNNTPVCSYCGCSLERMRQLQIKKLIMILTDIQFKKNKEIGVEAFISHFPPSTSEPSISKNEEDENMSTILGAGKYVFGEDIPLGKYNLKALSGKGMLQYEKLIDGTWEEEWINFGVEDYCAKTYHGLSLPQNRYFEVTGNVTFEITKAKMIVIE